jgi:alpha-beta hydrolase superfamily lysophospholipase
VPSVFAAKSVLVLAGADDTIVPWAVSRAFVEALDVGPSGRKEAAVVSGVRHEFTDGMREEVFRFFWEEALVGAPASAPAPAAVRRCAL